MMTYCIPHTVGKKTLNSQVSLSNEISKTKFKNENETKMDKLKKSVETLRKSLPSAKYVDIFNK